MRTTTVYLIHFHARLHHAGHYIGSAKDLDNRISEHQQGHGARLLQVVNDLGIPWEVARTWKGGRDLERKLKNQHHAPRLCPLCNPKGNRP